MRYQPQDQPQDQPYQPYQPQGQPYQPPQNDSRHGFYCPNAPPTWEIVIGIIVGAVIIYILSIPIKWLINLF